MKEDFSKEDNANFSKEDNARFSKEDNICLEWKCNKISTFICPRCNVNKIYFDRDEEKIIYLHFCDKHSKEHKSTFVCPKCNQTKCIQKKASKYDDECHRCYMKERDNEWKQRMMEKLRKIDPNKEPTFVCVICNENVSEELKWAHGICLRCSFSNKY